MKMMGAVLIVLGALALIYGGFQYKSQRTVLDVGPIKATATEHHSLPIPPLAGMLALAVGVALVVIPARRSA